MYKIEKPSVARQHARAIRPFVAALAAIVLGVAPCLAAERPNVVLILADDLGVYDLGCYGRSEHRTPHLDRLAAQGTRFTSAYCAQPICSPSRAALLTGKAPARLHLTTYLPGRPDCPPQMLLHPQMRQELPREETTLAEALRAAGYAMACIGKWHLGGEGFSPREQGFDIVHAGRATTKPSADEGGKGEFDLTAAAERFVEAHRQRPFFLYLCHNSPHIPFAARPELVARNAAAFEPTYAATIESLDAAVGRLLARLDELGLAEKTLVIFTSDNGGLHVPEGPHRRVTHNGPFRAGKGFVYEGGLRIPLLVRWPNKVPAGRLLDAPVVNADWLPTILELAGVEAPPTLDGVSFAKLILGRGEPVARRLFWHFPHYNNQGGWPAGAVRDGPWKLVERYEDGRTELFHLERDPGETTDLAGKESQRVKELQQALAAWRVAVGAQQNAPNPNFDAAAHRELYRDFDASRFAPAVADDDSWRRVHAWRDGMNRAVSRPRRGTSGS
jgi:arylsulfatase A-like enzyme